MISVDYIEMCRKAEGIQSIFINDNLGVNADMLPAFVFDDINNSVRMLGYNQNQFVSLDITKRIIHNDMQLDNLIWLPTIEQLVSLYQKFCTHSNLMLEHSDVIILNSVTDFHSNFISGCNDQNLIVYATKLNTNQLFLTFIMRRMFDLVWSISNREWILPPDQKENVENGERVH
jgi:hypothetical protein